MRQSTPITSAPASAINFEQPAGTDAEEDDRHAAGPGDLDRSLGVWQHKLRVVGRTQLAAPAIEELKACAPARGLGQQIFAGDHR